MCKMTLMMWLLLSLTNNCNFIDCRCNNISPDVFNGFVTRVIDGDTIIVTDGVKYRVRLYGVDTPERNQPFGVNATKFTKTHVLNKYVKIILKGQDRYGRKIGIVKVLNNNFDLNKELVCRGYAWYVPKYCKDFEICSEYQSCFDQARSKKLGLWKLDNSVKPSIWRKQKHNTKH